MLHDVGMKLSVLTECPVMLQTAEAETFRRPANAYLAANLTYEQQGEGDVLIMPPISYASLVWIKNVPRISCEWIAILV